MLTEEYLRTSRLFRRLKSGPHGQLVELNAARLVELGLAHQSAWRSLSLVSDLLSWIVRSRSILADLDEHMVGRYLRHRAGKRPIQRADCAALRRWLLVLRDAGTIAPSASAPIIPQDQISAEFGEYLQKERGLAPRSILRLLPMVRQLLPEAWPARGDLGRIRQSDVVRYVEHHARDASPKSARVMCSSLRAFLRYVHHKGLNPFPLAGCVPSKREWKLAHLPTYLSAEQVQNVLDSCDRATAIGRRDYAVLMMLSKLGLRANEVASLTLDNIDWRSGEMHVYAKGRQRIAMPIPPDLGAATAAYLRDGRPKSSCRRLFLRMPAPRIGFACGHGRAAYPVLDAGGGCLAAR